MWTSVVLLASILGVSFGQTPMSPKEQMHRLAYANNNFGINLHRKLIEDGNENVFFSPFSVSSVLTMLYRGSQGETADELRKLLHYTKFLDTTIFSAFQHYLSEVIDKLNPELYTIKSVSAMIVDKAFPILPQYVTAVQDIFQAFVDTANITEESVIVVDKMNTWARIKTNGCIKKLAESIDPETTVFLASAAYFKGAWKVRFEPKNTKKHPFYNNGDLSNITEVPMMHTYEQVRYFEDDEEDFTAVELLYEGRNVSMVICLPNNYDALEELELNMTAARLQDVRRTMYLTKTHLSIPKFKLKTDYSLTRPLRELGFKRLFQTGANLTDMIAEGSNLVLDEIRHKATIEVNEQGSVATAVTRAIMMKSMPSRIPDPDFKVDHPFIFAIFDIRNSIMLFMGRITHFLEESAA